MRSLPRFCLALTSATVVAASTASAQVARLVAQPSSITVTAGDSVLLVLGALDAVGQPVEAGLRVSGPRGVMDVRGWYQHGHIKGLLAGDYELIVTTVGVERPVMMRIPVTI